MPASRKLIEPNRLKKLLEQITKEGQGKTGSFQHIEARAETCFRLAMHPDTPLSESLEYLKMAFRIDGTNPRYAYHLSRLYFKINDLDRSAFWLKKAIMYCPTSHRIWTHVSLLHRELNSRYYADERYEPDALKLRAEQINTAIRRGDDVFQSRLIDFTPPRSTTDIEKESRQKASQSSPEKSDDSGSRHDENEHKRHEIKRLNQPGTCRWTGVLDIEIENLLESEPSERIRDKLIPLFDKIIELRTCREAGTTAFTVLGIEWMLCGYPVSTIRRYIDKTFANESDPSIKLLKTTCDLFEADLQNLPRKLNDYLTGQKITPLMAALIHKQRLLWRTFDFRALTAYRGAQKLISIKLKDEELTDFDQTACSGYITSLSTALKKLDILPPEPMPDGRSDIVKESITSEEALKLLTELEHAYQTFQSLNEKAFAFLKNDFEPVSKSIDSPESYTFVCSNVSGFNEFLSVLNQAGIAGIDSVDYLLGQISSLPTIELGEDFAQRLETCRKEFNELTIPKGFNKVLRRIEQKMKSAAEHFTAGPEQYAPELSNLIEESRSAIPVFHQTGSEQVPRFDEPKAVEQADKQLSGIDELRRLVSLVDEKINDLLAYSLGTFESYSEKNALLSPIRGLQTLVIEQAAELMYRLGKNSQAKKLWNTCYTMDKLNVAALTNLAVCKTNEHNDYSAILHAWQSVCEITYYYAIAAHNPKEYAAERAEFHHNYASAFHMGFIIDGDEKDERNENQKFDSFITFLNSAGSLREFIGHKIAEFLNSRFDLETPTLILGVERTATLDQRQKALNIMKQFVKTACDYLPERIRSGFRKTCINRLDKAFEACQDPKGLTITKNVLYREEEQKLVKWLTDVYTLQQQFFFAFHMNPEWIASVHYLDFLPLLDSLSSLPTGISRQYQITAISKFVPRYKCEPDTLLKHLETFTDIAALNFSAFILNPEKSDKQKRLALFSQLAKNLTGYPEFWKKIGDRNEQGNMILERIDDPQTLYPEEIQLIFQKQELSEEDQNRAIQLFTEWCEKYPAITGPARMLALLLGRQNREKEALPYLKKAAASAICEKAREQCQERIDSIIMPDKLKRFTDKSDYAGAREVIRQHLKKNPSNQRMLQSLINLYARQIETGPKDAEKLLDAMENDFTDFRKNVGAPFQNSNETPGADIRSLLDLMADEQQWGRFIAESFLSHYDKDTLAKNWESALVLMNCLIARYPQNIDATFYLMIAHFNLGNEDGQKKKIESLKKHWHEADRLAKEIIARTNRENILKSAEGVVSQIDQYRVQLEL